MRLRSLLPHCDCSISEKYLVREELQQKSALSAANPTGMREQRGPTLVPLPSTPTPTKSDTIPAMNWGQPLPRAGDSKRRRSPLSLLESQGAKLMPCFPLAFAFGSKRRQDLQRLPRPLDLLAKG